LAARLRETSELGLEAERLISGGACFSVHSGQQATQAHIPAFEIYAD